MRYDAILNVNGTDYPVEIEPHRSLLSVVRTELGLPGSKEGCDDSECGACMMLIDGRPVNSCSFLALQAQGRSIVTVEGLADEGELHPLQRQFLVQGGVQCGFCTPGMLISAKALLDENPDPSEDEIRIALSGNLCRCTGYQRTTQSAVHTQAPVWPRKWPQARLMPTLVKRGESRIARCSGLAIHAATVFTGPASVPVPQASVSPPNHE